MFKQLALPFPQPVLAKSWPNNLGFDLGNLEFWTDAGGVRNLDNLTYGEGSNWVVALHDLLTNPKQCDQ